MLRCISIALIALGGAVALANPNPLFRQIAQNSALQKQRGHQLKLRYQLNLSSEQKQKLKVIDN